MKGLVVGSVFCENVSSKAICCIMCICVSVELNAMSAPTALSKIT